MDRPIAYLSGRWLDATELVISPTDAGFVLGATVAEQLRTFAGRIFRLEDHLARLEHSLAAVGIDAGMSRRELAAVAERIVAHNCRLLAAGDDLGLSIFVTPGQFASYAPATPSSPTVCLHTYPLPFGLWAEKYRVGQSLVTTEVRQVPPQCWPPELKCRSRMHFYLADRRAAKIEPGARALLLDFDGFVTEASTANVLGWRAAEGLLMPRLEKILHGISQVAAIELAARLGVSASQRDLTPGDLAACDEVLLASTPLCLLPVTQLDGRAIGDGRPGEMFARLLRAWSELVGVDVVGQAAKFAQRSVEREG